MPAKKRRPSVNRRPAPPLQPPPEPIFDWGQIADRAVGRIMSTPKVQELGMKAGGLLDLVRGFVQQSAMPTGFTPGQPGPPPPRQRQEDDPRVVMGFGPDEALSVEKVKSRKKAMAQVLHSDKMGGSPEGMMRLNRAADTLLKELR